MTRLRAYTLVSIVGLLAVVWASLASAGGVVGTGTPSSCTEAALDAALAGGGSVTFNCGAKPFTMTVTTKTIAADTSLDGGGLLTWRAASFRVNAGVSLAVNNCTFSHGNGSRPTIVNDGTLTVTGSKFSDNFSTGPGVIENENDGVAVITNCSFLRNRGGVIYNYGTTVTVTNSSFSRNNFVIYNETLRTLTVNNCTFSHNRTSDGAIDNNGMATVTNSTFSHNRMLSYGAVGGAIENGAPCCGLGTGSCGGAAPAPTLTVVGSTFSYNHSGQTYSLVPTQGGGAIYNGGGGPVVVTNSTFFRNSTASVDAGGAIANVACSNGAGTLAVTNSTFSHNRSRRGGAIYSDGPVILRNTIAASNSDGRKSCAGNGPITDGGHNLRWPAKDPTCVGAFGDPRLSLLADNGGPTKTLALQPGSAAIDGGDDSVTGPPDNLTTDQRGLPRRSGAHVDIGAYELQQ